MNQGRSRSVVAKATVRSTCATVFVSLGLLLAHAGTTDAQQTFVPLDLQPLILKGVDLLTNADYDAAFEVFDEMASQAPDDPSSDFLKGMVYWHRLVVAEEDDIEVETRFFEQMDQTIETAKTMESANKDDAAALFWLGAGYGYKARYHSAKREWWSAYRNGKRTKGYFERVVKMAPENSDPYLGLGIYHYYAEVVPKLVKIFDFILNMGGDKELGLEELEYTLDHGFFTQDEAKFYLYDILVNYEHRPWDALGLILDLTRSFPGNRGFQRRLAELYAQLDLHEMAAEVWQQLEEACADDPERQILMRLNFGEQLLEAGKLVEARAILERLTDETSRGSTYQPGRAAYAMALVYDLLGDSERALAHYRKASESSQDEIAAVARRRIANPGIVPIEVLVKRASIFAGTKPSAQRVGLLETELRRRQPSLDKEDARLCAKAMVDIGKHFLFQDNPSKARDIFSEVLLSDLPRTEQVEMQAYSLRAVAHFRLGSFDQSLEDFTSVVDKADESVRQDIDKDMARARSYSEDIFPAAPNHALQPPEQDDSRTRFSCPDRGQLSVSVVGDFNGWNPERGRMSLYSGNWVGDFDLEDGEHRYCFIINGWERRLDPFADTLARDTGVQYHSIRNSAP
ncbi:tetratricopeptide repeat protein [Candidatus Eisenbacteria bacterium]|uniref:Tetratricopeptide repeat protein n=1 Tax=Eiseniibacteriota bacterium TaxID=2212470 RepID=A0ABV6YM48_UNCEI